jgi:hypothetical protein
VRKTSAFPKLAVKEKLVYSRFKGWTQEPESHGHYFRSTSVISVVRSTSVVKR